MMLLFFHVLYFLDKFILSRFGGGAAGEPGTAGVKDKCRAENCPESREAETNGMRSLKRRRSTSDSDSDAESKGIVKFSPPAYVQRYQAVRDILTLQPYGGKLKKIVDFGCSELGFFYYLKNIIGVEELLFVDIDRRALEFYEKKTRPLNVDYLHSRGSPLTIRVLEGSVIDPDKLFEDCDAVVCIELIEHLYPSTLDELPNNIFGFIRPKVAIITTPNADFNVLFKTMSKFRHPDHKFEWTRQQFQDWAFNIVSRYPEYSVTFHEICKGPPGTENLGACTQMAVFHRTADENTIKVPCKENLCKTVAVYDYPYKIDDRSKEEVIRDNAIYHIQKLSFNSEEIIEEIQLKDLLDILSDSYISLDDIRKILENAGCTIVDRDDGPAVLVPSISPFSDNSVEYLFSSEENPGNCVIESNENVEQINNEYNCSNNVYEDDENWDYEPLKQFEHKVIRPKNDNVNEDFDTKSISSDMSLNAKDLSQSTTLPNSYSNELVITCCKCTRLKNSDHLRSSDETPCVHANSKTTEASTSFFSTDSLEESKYQNSDGNCKIDSLTIDTMCSIFLEPSNISECVYTENLNTICESTITTPSVTESFQSFNNNASIYNIYDNTFEEPKHTSSPRVLSSLSCKNIKTNEKNSESNNLDFMQEDNKDLISLTNNNSKNTINDTCTSKTCIIVSNNQRLENPHITHNDDLLLKILDTDKKSPDTLQCITNNASLIVDSNYPNFNYQEHDISSQICNSVIDSESNASDLTKHSSIETINFEKTDNYVKNGAKTNLCFKEDNTALRESECLKD